MCSSVLGFVLGCPGIYCHYKGSGQTHHPSAKKEIPDASVDEPYGQHGRSDEHHHARTFLASCLLAFGDRLRTKTDDIVMSRTAALKSAELRRGWSSGLYDQGHACLHRGPALQEWVTWQLQYICTGHAKSPVWTRCCMPCAEQLELPVPG